MALTAIFVGSTSAKAATIGSNFSAGVNDSVCKFQSLEPETRTCTIGQTDLLSGHAATDGLVAPFDGVVVSWTVVSGTTLPGTGTVKLALRAMPPGYLTRGPEVELPPSPPGTRHTFAERMPVTAGQHIGLKMSIANRSTQEAGAPVAFRQDGIGTVDIWAGEQFESIWKGYEEGVELLMQAEVEPDEDRDGYGDLSQDCWPKEFSRDQNCDVEAPPIWFRSAAHQPFLKTGTVVVHASLSNAGVVKAAGTLVVKGKRGRRISKLRGAGVQLSGAGGLATLRLRVRRRALKAARLAAPKAKAIQARVRVSAVDAKGNELRELIAIHSRQ